MALTVFYLGFAVCICILTAKRADEKGYNPALWFLAGGPLAVVILALLPDLIGKSALSAEDRRAKKKTGDIVGGSISGIAVLLGFLVVVTGL